MVSATVEDDAFMKWVRGTTLVELAYAIYVKYLQKKEIYKPIPESDRFYNKPIQKPSLITHLVNIGAWWLGGKKVGR